MDSSRQVIGVEFAVFADVDQDKLLATIESRFDGVNGCFADASLGVVDDLQEAWWMLMSHRIL
jgi:hypothetical protein